MTEYFVVGIAFGNTLLPDRLVLVWASLIHPCRCALRHLRLPVSVVLQLFVPQRLEFLGYF